MKISEILRNGHPSVSFEVFPPKRDMPLEPVMETVRKIAANKPAFMSVTYGAAGGTTGSNTCTLARFVQEECGTTALAHLTCVSSDRSKIESELASLKAAHIENILCLRGDFPPNATLRKPKGFPHAVDLVKAIGRDAGFCLGGACYPERHPECAHLEEDIGYLKEKVEAGLDFLTTQMFFDNNVYFHYLSRLRNAGITVPVIAGIMPVTNGKQIARICQLSGTSLPPRFRAIVDRFGEDPVAMLDAGVAYATEQMIDLFANGVDNVHVYTMNKPELAARIRSNLSGILA